MMKTSEFWERHKKIKDEMMAKIVKDIFVHGKVGGYEDKYHLIEYVLGKNEEEVKKLRKEDYIQFVSRITEVHGKALEEGRHMDREKRVNVCPKCGGTEFRIWTYDSTCACDYPFDETECVKCGSTDDDMEPYYEDTEEEKDS